MDQNPSCVSDETLEKYVRSELGFFARLRVEVHLSHCSECRQALETIVEEVA